MKNRLLYQRADYCPEAVRHPLYVYSSLIVLYESYKTGRETFR